jgi:hypothetical protein
VKLPGPTRQARHPAAHGYPCVWPASAHGSVGVRLNRSITRRSCRGSHIPRPVAVGTPRLLSSIAMPYHDVIPSRRNSATMGANRDARAWARALWTLRPASPIFDFPVTAMASVTFTCRRPSSGANTMNRWRRNCVRNRDAPCVPASGVGARVLPAAPFRHRAEERLAGVRARGKGHFS